MNNTLFSSSTLSKPATSSFGTFGATATTQSNTLFPQTSFNTSNGCVFMIIEIMTTPKFQHLVLSQLSHHQASEHKQIKPHSVYLLPNQVPSVSMPLPHSELQTPIPDCSIPICKHRKIPVYFLLTIGLDLMFSISRPKRRRPLYCFDFTPDSLWR